MYTVSRLLTVLSAATLGYAHPTITARGRRKAPSLLRSSCQSCSSYVDISSSQLEDFAFWVQYAAAAYCHDNYSPPAGTKLSCWAGNCPDVEAAGAVTDIEFSK